MVDSIGHFKMQTKIIQLIVGNQLQIKLLLAEKSIFKELTEHEIGAFGFATVGDDSDIGEFFEEVHDFEDGLVIRFKRFY